MIDPAHELSVVRQAQLLDLSRASVYYLPQPTPDADLALMRRIDELHLEHPFAGARMLRDLLRREGHRIGRKHVATLMRKMDIEALYRKANTSRRHAAHPVYETVSEAREKLTTYLDVYNHRRPHTALDRRTPDDGNIG